MFYFTQQTLAHDLQLKLYPVNACLDWDWACSTLTTNILKNEENIFIPRKIGTTSVDRLTFDRSLFGLCQLCIIFGSIKVHQIKMKKEREREKQIELRSQSNGSEMSEGRQASIALLKTSERRRIQHVSIGRQTVDGCSTKKYYCIEFLVWGKMPMLEI